MESPNLSKEDIEKLTFVYRQGNYLVYQDQSKNEIMIDVKTVKKLGMPIMRNRKATKPSLQPAEQDIWRSGRSVHPRDRQATERLLDILKGFRVQGELFSSKKMRKKEIWIQIANQLIADGFNFRNRQRAWEKVSQKWRNLERTYRVHIDHLAARSRKGLGNKPSIVKSPEFFDDLHQLLATKYSKANRKRGNENQEREANGHEDETMQEQEETNIDDTEETYTFETPFNNVDYETEEEDSDNIDIDPGPEMYQQQDENYETYIEEETAVPEPPSSPSSSIVDDKSQIFGNLSNPDTAGIRDPVVRLLLEMRAQERAHFRQDRRERLEMQRESLEFRRELLEMLERQHQERMNAMHSLVGAITCHLPNNSLKTNGPRPNP